MDDSSADRLPSEAIVIRGGLMKAQDLEISAQTHCDEFGEYALSVFSRPSMTVDELAEYAQPLHGRIRATTVGALREAGYDVVPSEQFGRGHADLRLPNPPTNDDWQRLDDIFGAAVPNPSRRRTP